MNSFRSISSVTHHCLCIELTSTSFYRGSVDLYAFTGEHNLILSHNFHICHDEENVSASSKVYLSYVDDRSQIPRNCNGTDVRHLAYRCNVNDNYTGIGHNLFVQPASSSLIDDFRGASAVKRNGAVAGHVKRVDHDVFDALLFREETLTRHYFILKFDFSWGIRTNMGKTEENFSICNVIVT